MYPFRRMAVRSAKVFERYTFLNSVMALPDIFSPEGRLISQKTMLAAYSTSDKKLWILNYRPREQDFSELAEIAVTPDTDWLDDPETFMMVTGSPGSQYLLLVLWQNDYTFLYVDIIAILKG